MPVPAEVGAGAVVVATAEPGLVAEEPVLGLVVAAADLTVTVVEGPVVPASELDVVELGDGEGVGPEDAVGSGEHPARRANRAIERATPRRPDPPIREASFRVWMCIRRPFQTVTIRP
jgi:hypothetical protein